MFLIRCSILNSVNADVEESQYYISQDLKILPYYLIAFRKKFQPARHWWKCVHTVKDLKSDKGSVRQIYTLRTYEAINCYGSGGKMMLLEILQAHDFLQPFVLVSQSEDLHV